jgi:alpha-mannosidase
MIAVGERRWPDPKLPPEEALELMLAEASAAAAEVELAVLTPELRAAPGGQGELLVSVSSQLASQVHGEAQLVSPFGTWAMLSPPTRGFSAAPGEPAILRFGVTVPATTRAGTTWWALVKVMYFGRVRYSPAIPVTIVAG